MNRPIYYAHCEYTSAMQNACDSSTSADARPYSRLMPPFLENLCEYPHKLYTALESLNYMTAAIVWVYLINFTQLLSKLKKTCSRRALTRGPTVLWRLFSREPARISAQTLYRQKVRVPAENMPLALQCVSIFINLPAIIFESRTVGSQTNRCKKKQNLTRNSHSVSFKVMHFGITENPTDCVSLHNNASLIFKVS